MQRTITVKGTGQVSARPDYVIISMTLDSQDINYDKAMDSAIQNIQRLNEALACAGYEKDAAKTVNFNVRTHYDREQDAQGAWKNAFKGYIVTHQLKLEFDFDMKQLSKALCAIAGCLSHPQLSIAFTIKNPASVNKEALRRAAASAKEKAEILCEASGVRLGALKNIHYNWGESDMYSRTSYSMAQDCLTGAAVMTAKSIDMEPDNIEISDSAAFEWEIL